MFRNLLTAREGSAGFTGRLLAARRRVFVILTGTLVAGAFVASPPGASQPLMAAGMCFLPPRSRLDGALSRMTGALAFFTISGNKPPESYPDTPFQVLYYDPNTVQFETVAGGLHITGSNTFTVRPNTLFFVPVFSVGTTLRRSSGPGPPPTNRPWPTSSVPPRSEPRGSRSPWTAGPARWEPPISQGR